MTALGGLLLANAFGRPLHAQDRSIVELGASAIRFSTDSLVAVGPSARWSLSRERGPLVTSASAGAVAGQSGASGFVDLSGRRLSSFAGEWRSELGGELGALLAFGAGAASSYATSGLLSARLLRPIDHGGVWLRGSGSLAQRTPDLLAGRGIGAGAWGRWSRLQLVASVAREWNVAQLFTGPRREGYVGRVPVAYTEAAVVAQVEGDRASLSVSGAARRDPGAEHLVDGGLSVTAAFWPTPTRAFVVTVARQLPDFVHGADATQSLFVGLRLHDASPALERARRARPIIEVSGESAARVVRVRAPGARRVEIMGDFSDWEPLALAASGDVFSAVVPMSPGTRRVVVRVDGGAWLPAANTPAVDDDFGGRVGLLLVP